MRPSGTPDDRGKPRHERIQTQPRVFLLVTSHQAYNNKLSILMLGARRIAFRYRTLLVAILLRYHPLSSTDTASPLATLPFTPLALRIQLSLG